MRRSPFLLLLLVVAAATVAACTPAPPSGGSSGGSNPIVVPTTPVTAAPAPTDWTITMLTRVNAARAAAGVGPVQLCRRLTTAAQGHSADLAATNTLSHVGSNGSTFVNRIEAAGYVPWTALGENVASGYTTVDAVMTGWMNSPGHRANVLSASYAHVGVAKVASSSGIVYWTQDFGRGGSC